MNFESFEFTKRVQNSSLKWKKPKNKGEIPYIKEELELE